MVFPPVKFLVGMALAFGSAHAEAVREMLTQFSQNLFFMSAPHKAPPIVILSGVGSVCDEMHEALRSMFTGRADAGIVRVWDPSDEHIAQFDSRFEGELARTLERTPHGTLLLTGRRPANKAESYGRRIGAMLRERQILIKTQLFRVPSHVIVFESLPSTPLTPRVRTAELIKLAAFSGSYSGCRYYLIPGFLAQATLCERAL